MEVGHDENKTIQGGRPTEQADPKNWAMAL
jgi:hypothetical protein